jgi:hypothetical protein
MLGHFAVTHAFIISVATRLSAAVKGRKQVSSLTAKESSNNSLDLG